VSHAPLAPPIYGIVAEFDSSTDLVYAAKAAYAAGYRKMDAYSPFPIEEASDAIGFHKSRVPLVVLLGGLLGGLSGFGLQYWINVISYPLNIGGKPYDSWPAFIVPTFEMTILFAGLSGVFGMFALNGLPMPYHPLFNVDRFSAVTRDKFFLCVEAADPKFDLVNTQRFLEGLQPLSISEVPH
jgi:Alternative complex III, ActD subunit